MGAQRTLMAGLKGGLRFQVQSINRQAHFGTCREKQWLSVHP